MTGEEQALIKSGTEAAIKPFANLIERLFGGAVDQIGGMWEDRLMVRRQIRKLKLLKKLKARIDEAGFDPHSIPDSIWIPSLQEALLQDDETLQDKWASLLANAADPDDGTRVLPTFTVILKELSARDVKFLDALYSHADASVHVPYVARSLVEMEYSQHDLMNIYMDAGLTRHKGHGSISVQAYRDNKEEIDADEREFTITLDMLKRHRVLVETAHASVGQQFDPSPAFQPEGLPVTTTLKYTFSALGAAFVAACSTPNAR